MPKFAANISMLFTEVPFMERFATAKAAGFDAVEYQFAYNVEPSVLAQALKTNGLQLVLHNLPPGNAEKGERGMACTLGVVKNSASAWPKAFVTHWRKAARS